jgi:hypothetical protein
MQLKRGKKEFYWLMPAGKVCLQAWEIPRFNYSLYVLILSAMQDTYLHLKMYFLSEKFESIYNKILLEWTHNNKPTFCKKKWYSFHRVLEHMTDWI